MSDADKKQPSALTGVRILDFSWAVAGPLTTKWLAQHGAEVIRVESTAKLDPTRATAPFKDGISGPERSGFFANYNDTKRSLALNLNSIEGISVARRLVTLSDVVVENFTTGTLDKWGLQYQELRKLRPDIILVSISAQGDSGPHAGHAGLGTMLQALVGLSHVTGWPDREPRGLSHAYPDFITPWYSMCAVLVGLLVRRRTGKGQHLSLSHFEASLQFFGPALLEYAANGVAVNRRGNQSSSACPHGVYRCKGEDRWCAIAVSSQEEWEALCRAIGSPPWSHVRKFASPIGRRSNATELDRNIQEWTRSRSAEEVMTQLQTAGVPAGVVKNNKEMYEDPQLRHRGFFTVLNHAQIGALTALGPSFVMSRTPGRPRWAAPLLGQDTDFVCREVAGMTDAEMLRLKDGGVLS